MTIAVYAAADAKTPTVLTIVIINKDTAAASPTLAIESFTPTGAAQVWRVVNNAAPARGSDLTISGGKLTVPMPASSIAMVVVP